MIHDSMWLIGYHGLSSLSKCALPPTHQFDFDSHFSWINVSSHHQDRGEGWSIFGKREFSFWTSPPLSWTNLSRPEGEEEKFMVNNCGFAVNESGMQDFPQNLPSHCCKQVHLGPKEWWMDFLAEPISNSDYYWEDDNANDPRAMIPCGWLAVMDSAPDLVSTQPLTDQSYSNFAVVVEMSPTTIMALGQGNVIFF